MTVYLVGAGPGDPGLMTARSLELIAAADVIVYDRLIPDGALAGARADAILLYAGKEGGGPSVGQDEINAMLVEHGSRGSHVVRLKGGDPFVFGRGSEEAHVLREAGVAFEVVPGVTAGIAATAYAGIPVTHRGMASAVAFLTGHEDPTKPETALDWPAIAAFPGTLVFYMGVRQLPALVARLIEAGRPVTQPAAMVERGTMADQRTVLATLETLAETAEREAVKAPAITLIGDVAGLAEELAWFGRGPLAGRTIAVTRARAQASGLAARLRALGARVLETPAIAVEPIAAEVPALGDYDLLCVTSPNGVSTLFAALAASGRDARALAGLTVAAIGPGTARELAAHGIAADVVPERFVAEGLVEALAGRPVSRALVARAEEARDVLPDALRERGAAVDVLALYRTVAAPLAPPELEALRAADVITFTSASTVRFLAAACGGTLPDGPRLASIGPVTSEALREHGREPDLEAARADLDGLIEVLVADPA